MYKNLVLFTISLLVIVYLDSYFKLSPYLTIIYLLISSFKILRKISFRNELRLLVKNVYYLFLSFFLITVTIVLYNFLMISVFPDYIVSIGIDVTLKVIIQIFFISVFEEIIFRKYFLENLSSEKNNLRSIMILSICFSIAHLFTDSGVLYVFIISFILSIVYLKTRSLFLVILSHLYANLFVLFFLEKILLSF